ncbi:MAG: isocitrate lyase/phosphoenolpyruvate mutase family protein [Pleurocapsa sp. SU_196_0]|nr:isocitrate lyase/phosphoenolpyruvate mutase family protein [Pleurocapsa sp. SU_196_0]
MNRAEQATAFRAMHITGAPLILPNAWDAASARVIELEGAPAIATTSAGVAWTQGYGDGQRLSRADMIAAIRTIARTVRVPVTADIESGYGTGSVDDVTETVRAVIEAGAVGINLEDSPGRDGTPLLPAGVHVERIRAARAAAREAGLELFINARTDVYLLQVGDFETRLEETLRRASQYLEAGADGIFVPGVQDAQLIASLAERIPAPLNVMVGSASPNIAQLRQLGVARVSFGPAMPRSRSRRRVEQHRRCCATGRTLGSGYVVALEAVHPRRLTTFETDGLILTPCRSSRSFPPVTSRSCADRCSPANPRS